MTDQERALSLAYAVMPHLPTEEVAGLLRDAFAAVRADERQRVLAELRESIRVQRAQPASLVWEDQLTWS